MSKGGHFQVHRRVIGCRWMTGRARTRSECLALLPTLAEFPFMRTAGSPLISVSIYEGSCRAVVYCSGRLEACAKEEEASTDLIARVIRAMGVQSTPPRRVRTFWTGKVAEMNLESEFRCSPPGSRLTRARNGLCLSVRRGKAATMLRESGAFTAYVDGESSGEDDVRGTFLRGPPA